MKQKHIGKILRDSHGYYLVSFGVERTVGSLFEDFEGKIVEVKIRDLKEEKEPEKELELCIV